MLPRGEVFTPTATVPVLLNTSALVTGEAITWASAAVRLMRLRGDPETTTNWTEITDDVGYDIEPDWDPSASPRVGLHVGWVDQDGLTAAAEAGDLYVIVASAGTVDTENMLNLALAYWWVEADGLTAQQKADVNAEADAAIETYKLDKLVAVADADDVVDDSIIAKLASKAATADWSTYVNTTDSLEANRDNIGTAGAGLTEAGAAALATFFGIITGAVATDGGNSATSFLTDYDAGAKVIKGFLRLTSGALINEGCLMSLAGSPAATATVESQASMSTALKQFSATPADGVTWSLTPF